MGHPLPSCGPRSPCTSACCYFLRNIGLLPLHYTTAGQGELGLEVLEIKVGRGRSPRKRAQGKDWHSNCPGWCPEVLTLSWVARLQDPVGTKQFCILRGVSEPGTKQGLDALTMGLSLGDSKGYPLLRQRDGRVLPLADFCFLAQLWGLSLLSSHSLISVLPSWDLARALFEHWHSYPLPPLFWPQGHGFGTALPESAKR